MSDSVGRTDAPDASGVVTRLRDAHGDREDARDAVSDVGRDRLVALRDALDDARRLFDQYEERATGTGDFEAYITFQDEIVALVEDLPSDLPEREVFEGWLDDFKKRRLTSGDFDAARADLADARNLAARLDALESAGADHRQAVAAAKDRRDDLTASIDHLERVRRLGDADLDAPVDDLRDPIEAYNEAVRAAFDGFLATTAAREVLAFLDRAQAFPLVPVAAPPDDLDQYVRGHEVGDEPVGRLLELADFSRSKLDHFVDDPATLKRVVGGNRTFLSQLDAGPLTLAWPPSDADVLRRRAGELVSLVGRIADEEMIARLREVQECARTERYGGLRDAAVARHELTDADRERLRAGDVAGELETARAERSRIEDALDAHA